MSAVTKTSILLWVVPIALSVAYQCLFHANENVQNLWTVTLCFLASVYTFSFIKSRPIFITRAELEKASKSDLVPYSLTKPKQPLPLTTQLPMAPPKAQAFLSMAGLALEAAATTLANGLGLRLQVPRPLSIQSTMPHRIPTTKLAQAALALCRKTLPAFAVQHSLRTYWFGVAVADQLGIVYDPETFFVAAILHDVSWDLQYDVQNMDFEVSGAQRAHQFCQEHDVPDHQSRVIHEMIARHTAPELQEGLPSPELSMVHYGAGVDVAGFFQEEVHSETIQNVVREHPRLDFKNQCCGVLQEICRRNPTCHIAGACSVGFMHLVQAGPFDE